MFEGSCFLIHKYASLSLDHFNELDVKERDAGRGLGIEAKHGLCTAFDAAMVLLNRVLHVFVGTNDNGLQTLLSLLFI